MEAGGELGKQQRAVDRLPGGGVEVVWSERDGDLREKEENRSLRKA